MPLPRISAANLSHLELPQQRRGADVVVDGERDTNLVAAAFGTNGDGIPEPDRPAIFDNSAIGRRGDVPVRRHDLVDGMPIGGVRGRVGRRRCLCDAGQIGAASSSASVGSVSHCRHLSRCSCAVDANFSTRVSETRVGVRVSLLMAIQKPSVSMRPPSLPTRSTRIVHQRVERAEHHRLKLMSLPNSIGEITSMTVRFTIQYGCASASPASTRFSAPTSWI